VNTAVILAGGFSERFGQDKGLVRLMGKPLILHVFDRACDIVEEVAVVVSSQRQRKAYLPLFPKKTRILADIKDSQSPLVGALTGFANSEGDYSILLPCDTPFISGKVMKLLFKTSQGMDAVIPRWPNGYVEPLQAVYRIGSALTAAEEAIDKRETRLMAMISRLKRVRYISTEAIKELDPSLITFFNVNTKADLGEAEKAIKQGTAGY
jgi:molybdopterin-guanine dinucleotide biosynthesis protein A